MFTNSFCKLFGKTNSRKRDSGNCYDTFALFIRTCKNSNIRIVSRMGNMAMITKPDDDMMAEDILGITQSYTGTLFVEDRVAYDFLSIILEDKAPYI